MLDLAYPGLTFDENSHVYKMNGEHVPGVTGILNKYRPIPQAIVNSDQFQLACQFGKFVHKHTEHDDKGIPRDDEVVGGSWAKADMWGHWVAGVDAEILAIEVPVFSAEYWYAGTIDRIMMVDGELLVIDIKSGEPSIKGKWQLAAYVEAVREKGIKVNGGMIVSLKREKIVTSRVLPRHFQQWKEIICEHNEEELNG